MVTDTEVFLILTSPSSIHTYSKKNSHSDPVIIQLFDTYRYDVHYSLPNIYIF